MMVVWNFPAGVVRSIFSWSETTLGRPLCLALSSQVRAQSRVEKETMSPFLPSGTVPAKELFVF